MPGGYVRMAAEGLHSVTALTKFWSYVMTMRTFVR